MKNLLLTVVLGLALVACAGENSNYNTESIVLSDGTRVECNQAERTPNGDGWLCTRHLEFDSAGYPTKSEVQFYPDAPTASPTEGGY